jgi:hypothetical protein
MSDTLERWARNLDREVEETRQQEAAQRTEFILRRQLIDSQGPLLWEGLQEAFKARCEAYNKMKGKTVFVFSMLSSLMFIVKPDGGVQTLTSVYDPRTKAVRIDSSCGISMRCTPTVLTCGDGEVVYNTTDRGLEKSEVIAATCLEPFFKVCLGAA